MQTKFDNGKYHPSEYHIITIKLECEYNVQKNQVKDAFHTEYFVDGPNGSTHTIRIANAFQIDKGVLMISVIWICERVRMEQGKCLIGKRGHLF